MLAFAVMFEGFDVNVTSVVLPHAGKTFGADAQQLGRALSMIGMGAIAAWFLLRLADRWGRRPIMLLSVTGFSIGSVATALAPDLPSYTAIQFVTRLLLVTQIATAYVIVSETLPAHLRGRAIGILGAAGSVGAALPMLLLAPAEGSALGWRMLFIVGAAPLLVLPIMVWKLRETPAFTQRRASTPDKTGFADEFRALTRPGMRGRFVAMSGLWFVINFASAVSSFFFSFYVLNERGWTALDLAKIAPAGFASAFIGYIAAGWLMDGIGRRRTAMIFLGMTAVLTLQCYAATDWWTIALCWVGLQAMLGIWTIGFTLNSELFPTAIRAAANGWCHNLLGRWGMVIAPMLFGWVSVQAGSVAAAGQWLGLVGFLGLPLIYFAIPETAGTALAEGEPSSAGH
ncbi:MFS transporter [Sphingomonas sp. C3-2]|uniref:MFS transporter n=1 Tax=Sphingomonas sp. C3-2 TaxID=3062169 RepID=UPI00294B2CA9|nr:MFS transporter [Sphingomonas sp. C3-2]WOK35400.1 MFS transporter [Sphingomonas sp. C3-2]